MLLISFIIFNISFALLFKLFCKLTTGICKCSKHLVGKTVIVTGANAGIGYETAKDLAERGARVILACRNEDYGATARDKIIALTGNQDIIFHKLDLSSLSSVRSFADNILKTEKQLDTLINNAGVYETENVKTEDDLLIGMQINHFGPFLLTNLLLPLLKTSAPSRIVNVSSTMHRYGNIDFQNLNMEKATNETFNSNKVYATSKLCNILMTVELSRQLKDTGVTVNSLHPGVVDTNMPARVSNPLVTYVLPIARFFFKSSWEGAQTSIYLAVSPEVNEVSGRYFSDCHMQKTTELAQDTKVARKLWEISEKLVQLK